MQDVIKIKLKGLDCPHCAEKITADVKKIQELQNPLVLLSFPFLVLKDW